jgi:hypothetical protein
MNDSREQSGVIQRQQPRSHQQRITLTAPTTASQEFEESPVSATSEPDPPPGRDAQPARPRRLTRAQQLTLSVVPDDILAQVAIQAVLAALHDTTDPLDLFVRQQRPEEEHALVRSLLGTDSATGDVFNLMDCGFLLRWQELTSDGRGPEELPPLPRRSGPQQLFP